MQAFIQLLSFLKIKRVHLFQNDEKKKRKIAAEYVRLCGYKQHDNQWTGHNGPTKLTLTQIATQLGTSERNLQRALSIERNLTEPMKELLDSGVIIKFFSIFTGYVLYISTSFSVRFKVRPPIGLIDLAKSFLSALIFK